MSIDRRSFLIGAAAFGAAGWASPGELALETASRGDALERLAGPIAGGLRPEALLTALHGAALRHVGTANGFGKQHHILPALHAVTVATSRMDEEHRWFPLLWAVDYFQWARSESPTGLGPLGSVPTERRAEAALQAALDTFDGPSAERAVAALWRAGRRDAAVAILRRQAARDFREIGHKGIQVANGLQTLAVTGWAFGEEALRAMALTLSLGGEEDGHDVDATWAANQARAATGWGPGVSNDEAVVALLAALRAATPDDAAQEALGWLQRGVAPTSVWDAMLLRGAELLFDHPTGVEAMHAVTSSNAAYTAWLASGDDLERRLILLQNVARVADFRVYVDHWAQRRGPAATSIHLDTLEPVAAPSLDELLATIGVDRPRAAAMTLGWADPEALVVRCLQLAATRTDHDSHDYKLPVAVLEDQARISPRWRARYVAGCTARLSGTARPEAPLADRIRRI